MRSKARQIGLRTCIVFALVSTTVVAQFVPGHVFVSVTSGEGCFNAEFEGILEIDPNTSEVTVFADPDDGLCYPSGLDFTPTGENLLVSNFGLYFEDLGWVQSFTSDGSSSVLLDGDDGMANPSGANGIAYDREGNLYVVTGDNWYIMRYSPDETSEVFADADDGVIFQGAIAVAPNGDVFFCSSRTGEIVRITPDGTGALFDIPPHRPNSITLDRRGNLFVAAGAHVYRYDNALLESRRVLASGFAFSLGALTVSPDQTQLYVVGLPPEGNTSLYAIDIESGSTSVVAGPLNSDPKGIAVHINYLADLDGDRDIDLRDFSLLSNGNRADLNHDGEINTADFAVLIATFTGP